MTSEKLQVSTMFFTSTILLLLNDKTKCFNFSDCYLNNKENLRIFIAPELSGILISFCIIWHICVPPLPYLILGV